MFRGSALPIITANLCETCNHDEVNHSTLLDGLGFHEGRKLTKVDVYTGRPSTTIDNILIAIVSILFDED